VQRKTGTNIAHFERK